MVMADTGYFDSVSANLKTGVGAQVKGISEGVKANSDAGVSPSVNALDTGVKAAAAIGGLADGSERGRDAPRAGCHGDEGHGLPAHLQAARPGHRRGHPPRDDTPVPPSCPCLTLMSGFSFVRRTSSRRRSLHSSPRLRQRNRRATPTARSSPRWATPC